MKITASVTRSLAILLVVLGCAAGTASATDLSQPVTLVATPRLESSEFSETVLFAAPLPNGMHIGFIVNRPSEVPLAAVFPEHAPSRKVAIVYVGGRSGSAVSRSSHAAADQETPGLTRGSAGDGCGRESHHRNDAKRRALLRGLMGGSPRERRDVRADLEATPRTRARGFRGSGHVGKTLSHEAAPGSAFAAYRLAPSRAATRSNPDQRQGNNRQTHYR